MKTSPAGIAALEAREGKRMRAYLDTTGVWTIGVGHTGRMSPPSVHAGMEITEVECAAFLAADLGPVEKVLNGLGVTLTQNQFDACASLGFNIGAAALQRSTVVKLLHEGKPAMAADAFLLWNKPAVLASRREAERRQFLTPDKHPVPSAASAPQVIAPSSAQHAGDKGVSAHSPSKTSSEVITPVSAATPAAAKPPAAPVAAAPAHPIATVKAATMNPVSGMLAAAQAFEAVAPKLISMGTTAFKNKDDLAKQAGRLVADLGKIEQDFAHLDIASASSDIGDAWKAGQQVFVDVGISYQVVTDTVKALPGIPAIGALENAAAQAEALAKKLGLPV